MATLWGLDLDMSAVRLMRRDGDAWVEQGIEKIDSPDIEQRLERLIQPIERGGPVTLFLPRDQILYTQIALDARQEPQSQIERSMEGRTPYSLDELSFDWELLGNDIVQVAAIARDTLDEAAAFAEVRHLKIAGYSTLFSGNDFPRLPKFDGPSLEDESPPAPPVAFATARVPSRPPDGVVAEAAAVAAAKARFTPRPTASEKAAADAGKPVVDVEDTTPVVQVKAPQMPLDPGLPIAAPNAPPRVRTDIAAASVSGHAASLTPPGGSVRVRKSNALLGTLAVFAVAFLLTVGVAVLVWNMLPMRPGTTADAPLDTGAVPDAVVESPAPGGEVPENETAALPEETIEPEPTEEVTPEREVAETQPTESEPIPLLPPSLPDLDAIATADLTAPEPARLTIPTLALGTPPRLALPGVLPEAGADALPEVQRSTPAAPLPRMTASLQTTAPFLGPDPDLDDTSESIFFSAFELPEPAGDAIALPDIRGLSADELPETGEQAVAALIPDDPVTEPTVAPDPEDAASDPLATPDLEAPAADPVADAVAQAIADALAGPGGLIPTDLARSIPSLAPRARPDNFTLDIERQRYGGRTRTELAGLRPPARPESPQSLASAATAEASGLAVINSISPQGRPENIGALVTAARVQAEAARVSASASLSTPDTSGAVEAALERETVAVAPQTQPRRLNIPTTASVARQATIENAIRLNRINLVGVYGAPSDRRALVRLSSGRYVKVKVGDRVDGGTVRQITDNELYYRKGNRTLSLQVPQG